MSCMANYPAPKEVGIPNPFTKKENIRALFEHKFFLLDRCELRLPNNKSVPLTKEMADEIKENAICLLTTGVDLCRDIWAIQWEKDYKPKHFNLTIN